MCALVRCAREHACKVVRGTSAIRVESTQTAMGHKLHRVPLRPVAGQPGRRYPSATRQRERQRRALALEGRGTTAHASPMLLHDKARYVRRTPGGPRSRIRLTETLDLILSQASDMQFERYAQQRCRVEHRKQVLYNPERSRDVIVVRSAGPASLDSINMSSPPARRAPTIMPPQQKKGRTRGEGGGMSCVPSSHARRTEC
ncbi:hypothetical protein BD309DRAFT_1081584 [Dichomitus squalens]|nr:hypothetical protein BD309DRAFT_1081584 [Dichomitus squalens]